MSANSRLRAPSSSPCRASPSGSARCRRFADVSVECRAGEVHAVVGENGSGKSTLLGIASGFLAPDEGVVEIGGKRLQAAHAAEALRLGLGMAYQTYAQVAEPQRGREPLPRGALRRSGRRSARWTRGRGASCGSSTSRSRRTRRSGTSPLAERQLLEVVKALLARPKVLLLDEPTTALGPGEVERLHAARRSAVRPGASASSTSATGCRRCSGSLTGSRCSATARSQGTHGRAEMSEERLVALMIGRPLQLAFPARSERRRATEVLLRSPGSAAAVRAARPDAPQRGEILGIAGAEGNGQDEILRTLAGVAAGGRNRSGATARRST